MGLEHELVLPPILPVKLFKKEKNTDSEGRLLIHKSIGSLEYFETDPIPLGDLGEAQLYGDRGEFNFPAWHNGFVVEEGKFTVRPARELDANGYFHMSVHVLNSLQVPTIDVLMLINPYDIRLSYPMKFSPEDLRNPIIGINDAYSWIGQTETGLHELNFFTPPDPDFLAGLDFYFSATS